jgi:porphobilinogen synthase
MISKNIFIAPRRMLSHLQRIARQDIEQNYSQALADAGLRASHLVVPIFVSDAPSAINTMPGTYVTGLAHLAKNVESIIENGIHSIVVFGIPERRDTKGSGARDEHGVVQRAVKELRSGFGNSIDVITDICLCQYNFSGHCGLVRNSKVDNDETLKLLAEIACTHSEAGADMVAPSSMMDGQVRAIRNALDDRGLRSKILSYSAKHASSLYTPFRSAAFARPRARIDKSSYQVSYANPRQVMMEVQTDIAEGADMVMIKPAMTYLDLVTIVKDRISVPVAVQNVSGEYAMIKAAAARGWIDEEEWKVKTLASIKRAGADRIISYFAMDIAKYL